MKDKRQTQEKGGAITCDKIKYIVKVLKVSRGDEMTCRLVSLRTFAPIVSAHPYCARKSTCHAMPPHVSSARAKCYFEQ